MGFPRSCRGSGRSRRDGGGGFPVAAAHLDQDAGRRIVAGAAHELFDAAEQVLLDPGHHEAVRGEQQQGIVALDRLQWPHPGVELLLGHLAFELAQAAMPKRPLHELPLSRCSVGPRNVA